MRNRIAVLLSLALMFALVGACASSKENTKESKDETKAQAQSPEESEGEMAQNDDEEGEDEEGDEDDEDEEEGDEHPGDEHPGDEHPGDEKEEGEEHPGDEHPGDEAKKKSFSPKDIKTAMRNHIDAQSKDGVFTIKDEETGETLELEFVKIHDPVREMAGKGYFGCTDFHVSGEKGKVYDLDFWLNPKSGELKVTKSKVHKHPVKENGEWVKKARYTFKNDKIAEVK